MVERQLPKLNVEGSIPFTRFDALRCAGLHNVALCTELRTVETAEKRALVLHRIAHNCTRKRPARSHRRYRWRYAIRAGHRSRLQSNIRALDHRGDTGLNRFGQVSSGSRIRLLSVYQGSRTSTTILTEVEPPDRALVPGATL